MCYNLCTICSCLIIFSLHKISLFSHIITKRVKKLFPLLLHGQFYNLLCIPFLHTTQTSSFGLPTVADKFSDYRNNQNNKLTKPNQRVLLHISYIIFPFILLHFSAPFLLLLLLCNMHFLKLYSSSSFLTVKFLLLPTIIQVALLHSFCNFWSSEYTYIHN